MAMACCSSLARPQASCSSPWQEKQRPSLKVQNACLAWTPPGRQQRPSRSTGEARILCIGGGNSKEEAARKALEQALGGKKEAFSKWDEQLRKKEAQSGGADAGKKKGFWGFGGGGGGGDGGDGGGGGRGGAGGDDLGGAGPGPETDWEDVIQTALAFIALVFFYCFLTGGRKFLRFLLRLPRMLAGFSVMLVKDLKLFIPYQIDKVKDHIDEYIFDLKEMVWTIRSKVEAILPRKPAPSMVSDASSATDEERK